MTRKVRLSDMTNADRNNYKYHRQVLADLKIYGPEIMKKRAESEIKRIEIEYNPVDMILRKFSRSGGKNNE